PAVGQWLDLLKDALAVGVGSDHLGPTAILQSPGDDLSRGGGTAVDQNADRDLGGDRAALGQVDLPGLAAAIGRDDRAVGDEDAGHADGLLEQSAAVLPQIE